jgi:antitoxin HigA-1
VYTLKNAVHPGPFLRSEIIDAHDLSVTKAAEVLGVSWVALSNLLIARSSISAEMALRFEKAFDIRLETLLSMQANFDAAEARKQEPGLNLKPYQPFKSVA